MMSDESVTFNARIADCDSLFSIYEGGNSFEVRLVPDATEVRTSRTGKETRRPTQYLPQEEFERIIRVLGGLYATGDRIEVTMRRVPR